jgi:hypothetical protein
MRGKAPRFSTRQERSDRVRLQHDAMLRVRRLQQQPCRHYEVGDRVVVGWRTSETRLIPEG